MRMNFCKDCRHYAAHELREADMCWHLQAAKLDPVRGDSKPAYCMVERQYGVCGPVGLNWEPHPSTFISSELEASHVADD